MCCQSLLVRDTDNCLGQRVLVCLFVGFNYHTLSGSEVRSLSTFKLRLYRGFQLSSRCYLVHWDSNPNCLLQKQVLLKCEINKMPSEDGNTKQNNVAIAIHKIRSTHALSPVPQWSYLPGPYTVTSAFSIRYMSSKGLRFAALEYYRAHAVTVRPVNEAPIYRAQSVK